MFFAHILTVWIIFSNFEVLKKLCVVSLCAALLLDGSILPLLSIYIQIANSQGRVGHHCRELPTQCSSAHSDAPTLRRSRHAEHGISTHCVIFWIPKNQLDLWMAKLSKHDNRKTISIRWQFTWKCELCVPTSTDVRTTSAFQVSALDSRTCASPTVVWQAKHRWGVTGRSKSKQVEAGRSYWKTLKDLRSCKINQLNLQNHELIYFSL